MNSTFKIRLRIVYFISIFFLLLISSCNLNLSKPSEDLKTGTKPSEEDKKFDASAGEEILRRIEREVFKTKEEDIKTILQKYREKKFNLVKFRTSLNPERGWDYKVREKKNKNGKSYLELYCLDKEGREQVDKNPSFEEEVIRYLVDLIQYNKNDNRPLRKEVIVFLEVDNISREFFPRAITIDDIPKLKEILNIK